MQYKNTYDEVEALYSAHSYPLYSDQINVFGIRNADMTADKWNDRLGLIIPSTRQVLIYSGTTDPGASPLSKTEGVNKNGIFILLPGFYENCFQKGMHKSKYPALIQSPHSNFKGYRDADHDGKMDMSGKIWNDVQGLNYHTTRWDKKVMRVGDFSEACQVVEVAQEYDKQMELIYASSQNLFSYALFQG